MGDGENPKRFLSDDVGDIVGENSEVDAAVVAGAEAVEFGVVGNPQYAPIYFVFEPASEPAPRFLVVGNRVEELPLRLIQKLDVHGTNRSSAARITAS